MDTCKPNVAVLPTKKCLGTVGGLVRSLNCSSLQDCSTVACWRGYGLRCRVVVVVYMLVCLPTIGAVGYTACFALLRANMTVAGRVLSRQCLCRLDLLVLMCGDR